MELVETHAHLDDDAFANDLPHVMDAARVAGVRRFVNIGYEPESWTRSIALAERYPDVSYVLGMHPNSADRWNNDTASQLEKLLHNAKPVAIGETGLDYFWNRVDHSSQRAAFRDQLELARTRSLPVVIHMRGDVEHEMMTTLTQFPGVRAIFHSFDGSPGLRDFALARGDLLGVGGLMTRAGSVELRETLRSVPVESIVLETDSPYLTPKGVRDRRNTPANLVGIARALADLVGAGTEEVAAQTTINARNVFGLPSVPMVGTFSE